MNIPDADTPRNRRRPWLLGLPVLAVLVWAGARAAHPPHGWRQSLREFRGESSSDTGPNHPMDSALLTRQFLITHPRSKLSTRQSSQLVGYISSPVDEQSQSEALDVLSMAQRGNALSPEQAQTAQSAAISVLSTHPAPMVRLESARFLGHLGGSTGVPALTALQQDDTDPEVRDAAPPGRWPGVAKVKKPALEVPVYYRVEVAPRLRRRAYHEVLFRSRAATFIPE